MRVKSVMGVSTPSRRRVAVSRRTCHYLFSAGSYYCLIQDIVVCLVSFD